MKTKMSIVLPPLDLRSDYGGDEDNPLPDQSNDYEDDDGTEEGDDDEDEDRAILKDAA